MTTLLHFEEKVHRKDLARAEAIPLLMSRFLFQVLEHLGFPRGATYRASAELSSDLFPGADPVYDTFLSLTSAGGGRG